MSDKSVTWPKGYTLKAQTDLPEYDGVGLLFVHESTGCEIFHLHNTDSENLFSFNFCTPPDDDSGLPHIMEHSVLCGSRSFPVKDPFAHLLNVSMQTFLNAMTYPDKTVYPAASMNKKDYFNLMLVYGDSVFFPRITKEIFMQEGWHFEKADNGKLKVVGVVYNEMKGAYSSHESLVSEYSIRSLFPDSPYGFDSGGRPSDIVGLTYEKFLDFHKAYYHPSNCKIFLYGDIPTAEQLQFIEHNFLSGFQTGNKARSVQPVKRWNAMRFSEFAAPAGEDENGQTTISINWLTTGSENSYDLWSLRALSEILLGHSGSFLAKAVSDCGLGEDMSSESGLDTDLNEAVFSVSLRGTKRGKAQEFYDYIIAALKKLLVDGIPEDTIAAALKQMEFHLREKKGGSPMGLRLLSRSLRGWINGLEPWDTMAYEENLALLKQKSKDEPRYFENLIQRWLLDNTHVSVVTVFSDEKEEKAQAAQESDFLKSKQQALGTQGLEQIEKDLVSLREFQETDDDPFALARIPTLGREDLPGKIKIIPNQRFDDKTLFHPIFSNRIVYVDLAFDISFLSKQSSFYLPLLSSALTGCGLPGRSWDKVLEDLNLVTGGYVAFADASAIPGETQKEYFFIRIKALESDILQALQLCFRIISEGDFSDDARMKQILLEMRNDQKSSILPQGHSYAGTRAAASFSPSLAREEAWYGLSQLEFLNQLIENSKKDISVIGRRLEALRKAFLTRDNMLVNITADPSSIQQWNTHVQQASSLLPASRVSLSSDTFPHLGPESFGKNESFSISADVGYSALSLPGFNLLRPEAAHQILLSHILKTGYLWQTVRMKNGAYGAFAAGSSLEGIFSWSSYRDPNPDLSLRSFLDSLSAFKTTPMTETQLLNSLIGVLGHEEKPGSPSSDGFLGFRRDLYKITDEKRQAMRDWLYSANKSDLDRLCDLLAAKADSSVQVLLCRDKILHRLSKTDPAWKVKPIKWLK